MANSAKTEQLDFPPRNRQVEANWMPLYIEPMIGSGERLAIGVAVASQSEFLVVPVATLNRLRCVYGDDNDAIVFAAESAIDSITQSLTENGIGGLNDWSAPFEGILTGSVRVGAGESLEAIARQGIMLCSSLVEKLAETEEEDDEPG